MPPADAVLLPLCIGLALVGLVVVGVAWRRGRRGRVVQGLALTLAPVALYLSGLLRLVWDAVVALVRWGGQVVLSPVVWAGLSLLAVCVVLWVVGGLVARRAPREPRGRRRGAEPAAVTRGGPAGRGSGAPTARPGAKGAPAQDDDMAEIEALLKSRGIE